MMNLAELTELYDLSGKTAVVTGGAGVLGGEIAAALSGTAAAPETCSALDLVPPPCPACSPSSTTWLVAAAGKEDNGITACSSDQVVRS